MKNQIKKSELNCEHIWGQFNEIIISDQFMFRSIQFDKGSSTSIHAHSPSEVLFVISGCINCYIGGNPNKLKKFTVCKDEYIKIEQGQWHKVECNREASDDFALVQEMVFGENQFGNYEIRRAKSATKNN